QLVLVGLGVLATACGGGSSGDGTPDARPCVGLECQQVECEDGVTSISGVVYAPNGTLPLYNVNVYVPNAPVGAFSDGAQCDRCGGTLSGSPLVKAVTDTMGRFTLTNVPVGTDVPLVIQVGKWRRQLTVPTVTECTD